MAQPSTIALQPEMAAPVAPLHVRAIQPAEVIRNLWAATPPAGTAFEDVFDRSYWVHVAAQLRPGDRIEVMPADKKWFATLVVGSVVGSNVTLAEINHTDLEFIGTPGEDDFSVEFLGSGKWSVKEKASGKVIKDGYETQAEAYGFILGRIRRAA